MKGATRAPDRLEHFIKHPAREPQSGIVFSQGWLSGQQFTGSLVNDIRGTPSAWAKPPARGSMATAIATKETKIVRKMLMGLTPGVAPKACAVKSRRGDPEPRDASRLLLRPLECLRMTDSGHHDSNFGH